MPTHKTGALLQIICGEAALHQVIFRFYGNFAQDAHIALFLSDPENIGKHASRLANWVIEKMGGDGRPWTEERSLRATCPMVQRLGDGSDFFVHDRSSAYHAAWFSIKRSAALQGQRFKLKDARVWMCLMFWSCREEGLLHSPAYADWYVGFIAHVIFVYERSAPPFAFEAAEWSHDAARTAAYE